MVLIGFKVLGLFIPQAAELWLRALLVFTVAVTSQLFTHFRIHRIPVSLFTHEHLLLREGWGECPWLDQRV